MLKSLVRARGDPQLMNIISIMRRHDLGPQDIDYVIEALTQRCERNMVASATDVPAGVMTVVGTRAAMDEVTTTILEKKKAETPLQDKARSMATDQINKFGQWLEGDQTVSRKLDRTLHEPKELLLFKNWVYQLTYNNLRGTANLPRFSQGQLCLVEKLPTNQDDSVHARILPPGTRHVNPNTDTQHWTRAIIKKRDSFNVIIGSGMQKGRRHQYPLNYNIASTAHKAMGETLPSIATRIEEGSHYRLWDRNQLLVIISRITNLDHLIFIGNWRLTVAALRNILKLECPMTKWQSEILTRLDCLGREENRVIPSLADKTMNLTDCDVPDVDIGFVYLFCSSKNKDKLILGECSNIQTKIKELHSKTSSILDPFSPYILVGFFFGFLGDGASEENRGDRQQLLEIITTNVNLRTIGIFRMKDVIGQAIRENLQNEINHVMNLRFQHVVWKDAITLNRPERLALE